VRRRILEVARSNHPIVRHPICREGTDSPPSESPLMVRRHRGEDSQESTDE
jgi:hypothetical protein